MAKYGVLYEFSKITPTSTKANCLISYKNFTKPPIQGKKVFIDFPKVVKVLFLFDTEQERKDFDKGITIPHFFYSMRSARKWAKRLYEEESL